MPDPACSKTRRPHRKSRKGCNECKRRHIRCDEGRPGCTNCTIAERDCSYPEPRQDYGATPSEGLRPFAPRSPSTTNSYGSTAGAGAGGAGQEVKGPAPETRTPPDSGRWWTSFSQPQTPVTPSPSHPVAKLSAPGAPSLDISAGAMLEGCADQPYVFTAQHLALLHHVYTEMDDPVVAPGRIPFAVSIAVREAHDSPYLLDQLLALAAMHLGEQQPARALECRHRATELQTRALAVFARENESLASARSSPDPDVAAAAARFHCAPRFLFAGLLSLHVLADTLVYYRDDFGAFVDRLADCFLLFRGIQLTVTPTLGFLMSTELHALLGPVWEIERRVRREPGGSECSPLRDMVDSAAGELGAAAADALRAAIAELQRSFNICSRLDSPATPHAVSYFSVTVEPGFVRLLRGRSPEALVVLAYYGVLLHRCRSYWVFGDAGAWVVMAVAMHLGTGWSRAMALPLGMLDEERRRDPLEPS